MLVINNPKSGRVRLSRTNGKIRSLFGSDLILFDKAPNMVARAVATHASDFLSEHLEELGIQNINVARKFIRTANSTQSVVFQQQVNNIPVIDSEVVVSLVSLTGEIAAINNLVRFNLSDYKISGSIMSASDAISIVRPIFSPICDGLSFSKPKLFIYPMNRKVRKFCGDSRLPIERQAVARNIFALKTPSAARVRVTWRFVVVCRGPLAQFEIFIDAMTGEVISVGDSFRYLPVNGHVFMPDPVTSSGNSNLSGASELSVLNNELHEVELENLHQQPDGIFRLTGSWVTVVDDISATVPHIPEASQHFRFKYGDPDFLSVMAYYWTDRITEYVRTFNNMTLNDSIKKSPILISAHGGQDDQSLFFSDVNHKPIISLGEDLIPDASDAHVIVHEFGHAIHWHLKTSQFDDGYEDGFCDFLAAAWLDRFNSKRTFRESVFPWDNVSRKRERFLDTPRKFSDARFRFYNDYERGSILAATLWDLYLAISQSNVRSEIEAADIVLKSYVEMLSTMAANAPIYDLALGLYNADRVLNGGANQVHIESVFDNRGLPLLSV